MLSLAQIRRTAPFTMVGHLKSPWMIVVGIPILVAILDSENFTTVSLSAITSFAGTVPYIAFAVLTIAYLKAAQADFVIAEAFKGHETRMIMLAAMFGGLAPFCSCEVIPFIAGLLAFGAPISAVMAFWLSSPLIDPPTIVITAGALGWNFAIAKTVSAVALGLFGGFATKYVMKFTRTLQNPLRDELKVSNCNKSSVSDGEPVWKFWRKRENRGIFYTETLRNSLFLAKWLALAYVLESILVTYIPASFVSKFVGGDGVVSIFTAALVGMPAYLNGYVAPPLVAGLMEQGMSAGSALAFLVAGAVSCIPAMAGVWAIVNRSTFSLYLILGVIGAILSGIIFELIV